MEKKHSVILNSFIRRTDNTHALKILISSTGAKLSRKGRSRHWLLEVNRQQSIELISLISQSKHESWYWLVKKLDEQKHNYSFDELLSLAKSQSSLTVTQLMLMSDCTLAEARKVIDLLEWQ